MRSTILLLALAVAAPLAKPLSAQTVEPLHAQAAQPVTFWEAIGDTTLERLVGDALSGNHDLRAVEARVRTARAVRSEARLDLAPVVTASGGYSRQRLSSAAFPGGSGTLPDQDVWDAGLRMSWEIDVFGRGRRTLQGRNALLASAEHDVYDVQVLLAAEVAGAYFDLRGTQDRLAVARRNADNQRRTLDVTLARLDAGRGTAIDSERAQAQLSSTLAAIPALESAIAAIQHRIGVLLGRAPATTVAELDDAACMPILPATLVVADVEVLARQRPDVRSAERRLAAQTAFVGAAKADYLPRLSIGAVAGYTADAFDALGNSGTPRYAIGPVISWPLLDIGRVKSRVDAANAERTAAAARYEQTVLRALEDVETSLVAYRKAHERLQHLERAADASERAGALARLRFEEGVADFLEVLDAERTLLDAQDLRAAGRAEATARLVDVYRALGGQWPSAAEQVP